MTPLEFNIQVALFVCTALILTMGIVFLVLFQWKIYKDRLYLSVQLRIHLFVWLIFLAMSLTYYAPVIFLVYQEGKLLGDFGFVQVVSVILVV
jgi:hypothetical protein